MQTVLARKEKSTARFRAPAAARPHATQPVAVRNILRQPRLQAKLKVGAANDRYEQEADRVADRVMRMPTPGPGPDISGLSASGKSIQRTCAGCEEELQRKEAPGATPALSASSEGAIRGLSGGGAPLPASERAFFEPRFGQDFGDVRVHNNAVADASARSINARAFTLGSDIAFARGEYTPGTLSGRRLLAHELTHVGQQQQSQEISRIQRFRLATPRILGLPDIYIEPIPHTHPLVPCVPTPVTHVGATVRLRGPLSTGKGKILANLHVGVYRDPSTGRACFVMFESHATGFCLKFCFPSWNDLKRAWRWLRDKIAEGLKFIFAAIGIAVAAWVIYLIASVIATALMAIPVLAAA